jgi:hypothetical protein
MLVAIQETLLDYAKSSELTRDLEAKIQGILPLSERQLVINTKQIKNHC